MKNLLFICLFTLADQSSIGQFHYTITSVPDSAEVKMNGETKCHTPCLVKYRWHKAVDGRIAFEVSSPGFASWHDTISSKPRDFNNRKRVDLQRNIPEYNIDSAAALIGFDRLLADFKDGTPIGRSTDKFNKVTELKWEGSVKIGERAFERKFEEVVKKAGFNLTRDPGAKLFSKGTETRQRTPRYLVGVKLVEYDVDLRHDNAKDHGAGPVVGTTRLGLEWQVLDKSTGKIVLTIPTEGSARYRERYGYSTGENLAAFEDALIKFLEQGELRELVQGSRDVAYSGTDSVPVAITRTIIPRPNTPAFGSLSEMIKYADKACVTIMTDDGHGSGAVIHSDGYILSAYHVVEGSHKMEVQFSDGLKQLATITSFDEANDIVLLEISGSGYKALPLAKEDETSLGDEVITIGTPADLSLGQSVARGILSGKRLFEDNVYLQTDMSVSPGNSGGPLLNVKGEIIGIVQRKVIMSGVEGIGFAIPIERAAEKLHIQMD